jgi:hypothetical protein
MTMNLPDYHEDRRLRPIFIGGCPRSGTTMLGAILGEASNCFTTPETIFKQIIMERFHAQGTTTFTLAEFYNVISCEIPFWRIRLNIDGFPQTITRDNIRSVIDLVLLQYAQTQSKSNVKIWIDHTPPNILNSLLLDEFYPDAKFIHLVRDPRGVAASSMKLAWGPNSPRQFSNWWAYHLAHGLAIEQHFQEKCLRVRYEDILQRICDFCGIAYHPDMLRFPQCLIPSYSAEQHRLVGSPPAQYRALAWKDELHPLSTWRITSLVGELIDLLGYDRGLSEAPQTNFLYKLKWIGGIAGQKALSPIMRKRLRIHRRKLLHTEEVNLSYERE